MIADQASETRSNSRAVRSELSRLSIATLVAASSSSAIRSASSKSALPRYGCSASIRRASSALSIRSTGGAGPRRGSCGRGSSAGTAVPSALETHSRHLVRQGGPAGERGERRRRHHRDLRLCGTVLGVTGLLDRSVDLIAHLFPRV